MKAKEIEDRMNLHLEKTLEKWKVSLGELVACPSVRDLTTKAPGAPFGQGIRAAFDCFGSLAQKLGFQVEESEGYAIDARWGEAGAPYAAVLGHLDVVPAGEPAQWIGDPFTMEERDGFLYGRGVNDDKGPLLLTLYAADLLRRIGFPAERSLRIIAGGAEETTWECVDYYFQHHPQPVLSFTPDGNFPIVNHELGILNLRFDFTPADPATQFEIHSSLPESKVCAEARLRLPNGEEQTFLGKPALSRNPRRGINALNLLFRYMKGKGLVEPARERKKGLLDFFANYVFYEETPHQALLQLLEEPLPEEESSLFTQCATAMESVAGKQTLYLDLRYPFGLQGETLLHALREEAQIYGAHLVVEKHLPPLFVPEKGALVRQLSAAYRYVMKEEIGPVSAKGAASYARALHCGVNFGPTFPGEDPGSHFPDEHFSLASARKLLVIYALAIAGMIGQVEYPFES